MVSVSPPGTVIIDGREIEHCDLKNESQEVQDVVNQRLEQLSLRPGVKEFSISVTTNKAANLLAENLGMEKFRKI